MRAFILRIQVFSESDLICRLFSDQGTSHSAIARGGRKSQKRFGGGVLEPLKLIQVELGPEKPGTELRLLKNAQAEKHFEALRTSYWKMEAGTQFAQVFLRLGHLGNDDRRYFDLLGHTLSVLETLVQSDFLPGLFLHFYARFLVIQGVSLPVGAEEWGRRPLHHHEPRSLSSIEMNLKMKLEQHLTRLFSGV